MCYQLAVNGDDVCEANEMFTVSATPVNPLDIITGTNVAMVTIFDDGDSKFGKMVVVLNQVL